MMRVGSRSDASGAMSHFSELCRLGGRLAGTTSEQLALDYAEESLRRLHGGTLTTHRVDYRGWRNNEAWIKIGNRRLDVVALPCGVSINGGVRELEIIDAQRGTPAQLQQLGSAIQGRAVLVTHEYMFNPGHVHRIKKVQAAVDLGAAGFVIACPYTDNGAVSGGIEPTIAGFGVDQSTGQALRELARSRGSAVFCQTNRSGPAQTRTIDWLLTSPHATREVIVCAHIDGHDVAQSALDNASGAAVALRIAELASIDGAQGLNLPKDLALRVLLFSAEEFGLLGSEQYVAKLTTDQKKCIAGVINLDCVGGSMALTATTSGFDSMVQRVEAAEAASGIPVQIHNELIRNSDHYNFAMAGIPALRLIAGFGETDSKLRHVLTGRDRADLVTIDELDNALRVTRALVEAFEYS